MTDAQIMLTVSQSDKLRHMIGFGWDKVKKGKYRAYRNGYAANDILTDMEQLCRLEICCRSDIGDKYIYYCITKKGAKLLGDMLGVNIILED